VEAAMSRLFPVAVAIGLLIGTPMSRAVDALPKYDVAKNCKAELAYAIGIGQSEDACLNDEKQSREKLASEWGQYSKAAKSSCIQETNIGTPSYVELQTCLEMAKWAERR
jgi:hypothetical protein